MWSATLGTSVSLALKIDSITDTSMLLAAACAISTQPLLSAFVASPGKHGAHVPVVEKLLPVHATQEVRSALGPWPASQVMQVVRREFITRGYAQNSQTP